MFLYPKIFAGKETEKEKKEVPPSLVTENIMTSGPTSFETFNDFKSTSLSLLKNKTFVALSISETFDGFVVAGLASFLPKMMESQFGLSASLAALIIGL